MKCLIHLTIHNHLINLPLLQIHVPNIKHSLQPHHRTVDPVLLTSPRHHLHVLLNLLLTSPVYGGALLDIQDVCFDEHALGGVVPLHAGVEEVEEGHTS